MRGLLLIAAMWIVAAAPAWAAGTATTTTLSVTSGGATVSSGGSIASPAQITLTATVLAGTNAVTKGTVNFCVSGAAICSDVNLIGTAQLTSTGTAFYTFVPAIGAHSYVAIYAGTTVDATSTSSAFSLTVAGGYPTASVLTSTLTSSNPDVYSLTDTVTGGLRAYPSGTVSFQDTADTNYVLGTAALANGTSSFLLSARPTVNTTTNYTRFVAMGDVNGDGIPDIVTSLFSGPPGPGVQVFTGKGDGTFNTGTVYTISSQSGPQFVALADFNNDGCPDILAETFSANQLALYLNTKTAGVCAGTFAAPIYFSGPGGNYALNGPGGLAVGDFNRDGNLDIVVNNNGTGGNAGTDSVVFFGDGAGGFAAATPLQLAPGGTIVPQYTAVGDFNGDGFPDLAIANDGTDTFNVYLNNGTGGFTLAHTYTTPAGNGIIKAADLNQDGKLDLAISSTSTSTPITVWKGNGDGSFTQQASPTVGSISIASFSVADFNGDGKPDLVYNTSSTNATGDIYVVLGNGDFTFQAPSTGVSTLGNDTLSLAVGDFNGDGYSDVVVGNYSSESLGVYLSSYQQTATATLTGVSVSGASVNPHPVDAVFPAGSPYAAGTSNTVPLTASVLSDGITLTDLTAPNTAYGKQASFRAVLAPYTSQGYSTNGENVTFYDGSNSIGTAPLTGGVAVFNTTTLAVGSHSLTATYTADGNFAAATSSAAVSHPVTISPDVITVSSPVSPDTVGYTSNGSVTIVASSTSGQPLTYTTSSAACTLLAINVVSEISTGTCVVNITQAASGNYAAATPQTVTINIVAGTDTITFPALPNTPLGAAPPVPAATAASGVAPTYTSSTTSVCTVTSAGTITDLKLGTCTITASQGAIGYYAAATPVSQSFQVTPMTDTITVSSPTSPDNVTYNSGSTVAIMASSTSGQPLTYATTSPACTVSSTGVITEVATGSCVVTLSQAAAGNYAAATPQTVTVNIGTQTNTITFPALPNTAINATPPVPAATATSGVAPTYTSSTAAVCTVTSAGVITELTPGTCTITASQAAVGNYAAATPVSESFQVTALTDTITVSSPSSPDNVSYTSGSTLPISASSTSGQPLTYATTSPACTVSSTGVITEIATGSCVVTLSQAAAGNYAAATPQTVTVNIGLGKNTITFPPLPNTPAGATPPVPDATSTAGGTIAYASATPGVCTISGSAITDLTPGTCTITANQAATGNYAAAAQQTQSYQVTPLTDTITIPANVPTSVTLGGTLAIAATTTSGVAPTYTSTTPSVCSVSATSIVTTLTNGTCSITVSQAAAGNYAAATPQTVTISIGGQSQTIQNFGAPVTVTYGGTAPLLAATATSGLTPTYSATGTACSVTNSGAVTILAAGSCQITASQAGNSTYAAATPVTETLTVNPEADIITIPGTVPNTATAGGTVSIGATTTSGVTPAYTSTTPTVCSVSTTGIVTALTGGTCSVTVSQAAAGNYAAATPRTVTISVGGQSQTIQNFGAPVTATYGGAAPVLAATATSGLTPTYSATGTACSVTSSGTVTILAAGSCQITASQAGNSTYAAAAPVAETLTVNPAADVITIPSTIPVTASVGSNTPVAATTTSGVTPIYTSTTPAFCSVSSTGVITTIAMGTCTVTVTQPAAGNYAAATPQTVTISVGGQSQTIQNFGAPVTATYGGVAPVLAATATSGLTPTYSATGTACSVTSSGTVTILAAGSCQITASQAGNSTYAAAAPVAETLTVNPAADVITIPPTLPATAAVGSNTPIGATTTSGVTPIYTSTTPSVCSVSSAGVVTGLTGGSCSVTVSQAAAENYAAATPQTVTISVSSQSQTIQNFGAPITATYGSPAPVLTATATSGLAPTYTATGSACSVSSTGVVTILAVGTCQITASQAGNASYAAATPVTETLTVNAAADTITIPPTVPSTTTVGTSVSIGATTTSGVSPTYTSTTPSICSVSSTGVILTTASGTCSITVTQPAAGNYAAATPQTVTISVSGGTNTITFPALPNTPFSSVPPVPSATATSGQPVTYSASTAACSVTTSGLISFNSIGTCSITAAQAATGSYVAATPVTQSFLITPGVDAIVVPSVPATGAPGSTISIGATSTSGAPITYTSTTPTACSVTSPGGVVTVLTTGTCTITLSQPAAGNYAAAPNQTVTFNMSDFMIAANTPTSQTVAPGGVATYTFTLAPLGGQYPGSNVTYTVTGLPPGATYTLTPASGSVTQTAGSQTLTLTINTAQATAMNRLRQTAPWTLALLLPFFMRRKLRRRLAQSLMLLLLFAGATFAVTGCSVSNASSGQQVASYTITVTATSGGVTHSAVPVTLQVQ